MTAEPRPVEEIATPDPDREWFVAGVEDDDEHPWWVWSFTQCAAGDECDHDECKPVPVVALHAPEDGDRFDVEERLANWIVAAHNDADRLAAADRENAELRAAIAATATDVERYVADRLADARQENAELRGEVDRLRNSVRLAVQAVDTEINRRRDAEAERDDLCTQLAAAQAQLAEVESVCADDWLNPLTRDLGWDKDGRMLVVKVDDVLAALSAAPQPEPETNLPYSGADVESSLGDDLVSPAGVRRAYAERFAPVPPASDEPDDQSDSPNVGSPADEAASDEPARCEP